MNIITQEARPSTSKDGEEADKPITSSGKLKILQDVILTTPKKKNPGFNRIKIKTSPQSAKPLLNTKVKDTTKSDKVKDDDEEETWSPIALRLYKKIETFVTSHNHLKTLLETWEIQLLKNFNSMESDKYRFFCLKLYLRIPKWYNIYKLSTALKMELSGLEVADMYEYLSANGFVQNDFSQEPCFELLNNMLAKDLKDICNSFKLKSSSKRKLDLIEKLLTNCNSQRTLTFTKSTEEILRERIKEKMGYCIKLHPDMYKLFYKLHLLYTFTTSDFNTTSDLYLFLSRAENKDIIIPKYKINVDVKVFSSISEFSKFMEAHKCKQLILDYCEKKNFNKMLEYCILAFTELKKLIESGDETLRSSYMMRFTAGHKYTRALSIGAKHLARHFPNNVEEWLTFLIEQDRYNVQMRGTWYDLLALVQYNYLKEIDMAASTIIEALQRDDLSQISYYELNNRAEIIKRNKTRRISELQSNDIARVQLRPIPECGSIEISARHIHEQVFFFKLLKEIK
ncbi:hypothetical protein ILUMI_01601 [Ignelater luminosus]|uniref:Fanconi-associated nuclease n=1 Tax=Ignelater luminosus TaxID=2038154 RepID=A0A8K0DJQ0_IGNLU|nr:hypothetical protein ILUMI_01601 [Ignelater luminosus]